MNHFMRRLVFASIFSFFALKMNILNLDICCCPAIIYHLLKQCKNEAYAFSLHHTYTQIHEYCVRKTRTKSVSTINI